MPVTMKRLLDPDALRALSRGCAILGAGGGGDSYVALLQALQATEDFGPVPLVDLDELPDDALIMPCGGIGAPTVTIEKFENGDEGARLRENLQFMTGRRVAALMAAEIGAGNGALPGGDDRRARQPGGVPDDLRRLGGAPGTGGRGRVRRGGVLDGVLAHRGAGARGHRAELSLEGDQDR